MVKLHVEIVETPLSLAQGLMFRKSLEENSGMLFKFSGPMEASFWGRNTYIPLDVAFIDKNNRIVEIKQITPLSTRIITSSNLCNMAVEANAGFFQRNNIKPGYKVDFQGDEISFFNA